MFIAKNIVDVSNNLPMLFKFLIKNHVLRKTPRIIKKGVELQIIQSHYPLAVLSSLNSRIAI